MKYEYKIIYTIHTLEKAYLRLDDFSILFMLQIRTAFVYWKTGISNPSCDKCAHNYFS